ncbi:hypothetical protein LTR94_029909, partial [Friedmanniomyces endolithicus]
MLTSERVAPFSYQFPLAKFPQVIAVTRISDGQRRVIAEKPLEDRVPISFDAVGVGPRAPSWRSDAPATLYWLDALDGGDPSKPAEARDSVVTLSAPFAGRPVTAAVAPTRITEVYWGDKDTALFEENWYKTRARRISRFNPARPSSPAALLFEGASDDHYADPGEPLMSENAQGRPVLDIRNGAVVFKAPGGTPQGDRPALEALSLANGERTELWRSSADFYEAPQALLDDGRVLLSRESAT